MSLGDLWNALLSGLGALLSFFYDLVPNYGVAIILLTIAVRTAMIPLTIKQTRSMQEMSRIQPELVKLRAKHKGDRQKLTEETMKLYKEHGVNPYGGCLPLVLQMPVFIALFQVFQRCGKKIGKKQPCPIDQVGTGLLPQGSALKAAIISGKAGFLGMNLALTPLQSYRIEGLVASIPYFVWVLLMAGTMYYQQKQMTSNQAQSGPVAPQMQMMTRIMPVMLGVFSLNFPVALTVYWVTSNIWTIGQQYFMVQRKRKPAAVVAESKPVAEASNGVASEASAPNSASDGSQNSSAPSEKARQGKHPGSGSRKRSRKRRRR